MSFDEKAEILEAVRTKRIEIVGNDGECRAVLGQGDDQLVGLALYDKQKKERLKLKIRENGNPEVMLFDDLGHLRLKIFVNKKGEPKILLTDGHDSNIIKIAVNEDDESVLELRDDVGNTRVALFVNDEGVGAITVFNDSGSLTGSIPKQAQLLDALGDVAKMIKIVRDISGT